MKLIYLKWSLFLLASSSILSMEKDYPDEFLGQKGESVARKLLQTQEKTKIKPPQLLYRNHILELFKARNKHNVNLLPGIVANLKCDNEDEFIRLQKLTTPEHLEGNRRLWTIPLKEGPLPVQKEVTARLIRTQDHEGDTAKEFLEHDPSTKGHWVKYELFFGEDPILFNEKPVTIEISITSTESSAEKTIRRMAEERMKVIDAKDPAVRLGLENFDDVTSEEEKEPFPRGDEFQSLRDLLLSHEKQSADDQMGVSSHEDEKNSISIPFKSIKSRIEEFEQIEEKTIGEKKEDVAPSIKISQSKKESIHQFDKEEAILKAQFQKLQEENKKQKIPYPIEFDAIDLELIFNAPQGKSASIVTQPIDIGGMLVSFKHQDWLELRTMIDERIIDEKGQDEEKKIISTKIGTGYVRVSPYLTARFFEIVQPDYKGETATEAEKIHSNVVGNLLSYQLYNGEKPLTHPKGKLNVPARFTLSVTQYVDSKKSTKISSSPQ